MRRNEDLPDASDRPDDAADRTVSEFRDQVAALGERMLASQADGDGGHDPALIEDLESAYAELRAAQEELRNHREQLHDLLGYPASVRGQQQRALAGLPVATLTTDTAGRITSVNPAAVNLFQAPASGITGDWIFELVDEADRDRLRRCLEELVESREGRQLAVRLTPPGGSVRVVTLSAVPTATDRELIVTWVVQPDGGAARPPDEASRLDLPHALVTLTELAALCAGPDELISRASEICHVALGERVSVSLMLGSPREPQVVSSSSQLAQAVDGTQIRVDQGPCLDSHETGRTMVSEELRSDGRWPRLREHVADLDVGGVVAAPLTLGRETIGALNAFTGPGVRPDQELIDCCELLAAALSAVLGALNLRVELESTAEGMRAALQSRAVIEQAKGIIMADKRCTADEAFAHLVSLSGSSHVKVREVAAMIVDRTSRKS